MDRFHRFSNICGNGASLVTLQEGTRDLSPLVAGVPPSSEAVIGSKCQRNCYQKSQRDLAHGLAPPAALRKTKQTGAESTHYKGSDAQILASAETEDWLPIV